jgi:hypothetical protein
MTAITVTFHCVGPDRFEGELGADDAHARTVHLHFVDDDTGRVQLWQQHGWGKNPCGHGSLQRVGDGWWGLVEDTVNRQSWTVNGEEFDNSMLLFLPAASSSRKRKP